MRRLRVLVFAAGAAALLGAGCAQAAPTTTTPMPSATPVSTPAAAVRAAGLWGRAIEVPGLGALNKGRNADVNSVSCAAPGSCAAVGGYTDGGGHRQGFVVSEVNGVWGRAVEVPGLGFLNMGGHAGVNSVSCGSAGSCAAVGDYADGGRHQQGFVAVKENGGWSRAVEVPGLGALNKGGAAYVSSVSCGSPGNCAAGGQYSKASGDQAFVISEVNGTWAAARAIAGTLSSSGGAQVTSVSCASAGNCAAGGQYDYGGYNAAFLVNEKNGVWGKETTVPGVLPIEAVRSVSCASAGSCVAGGSYAGTGRGYQAFVT